MVSPKVLSREAGGIFDRGRELNHKIVNSVDANVEVAEVCTLAFIFALTWLVASGRLLYVDRHREAGRIASKICAESFNSGKSRERAGAHQSGQQCLSSGPQ